MTLRDVLKRLRPGIAKSLRSRGRGRHLRRRVVRSSRPATRLRYGLSWLVPCPARAPPALPRQSPAADPRFLLHARLLAGRSDGRRVERRLSGLRGLRPRTAARVSARDPVLRKGAFFSALRSFARESGHLLLGQRPVQSLGCLALLLPHPPLPAAARRRGRRRPFDQARVPGDPRERKRTHPLHRSACAPMAGRARRPDRGRREARSGDAGFGLPRASRPRTSSSSTARTFRRPGPT